MLPSPDDVGGLLSLASIPFASLLGVVVVVHFSASHYQRVEPKVWARGALAAMVAAVFSFLLYGYSFRTNDYHAQQLPILERLADKETYAGDSYVDTAEEFPSYSARLLAQGFQGNASPERLFFLLHLLVLFLGPLAVFFLSKSVFEDERGALIALTLFVTSYPLHLASPLALEAVARDHFDLTAAAWPFAIGALALWFREQTIWASVLAGLICYVNPLLGLQLLALLVASTVAEGLLDRKSSVLWKFLAAAFPGAAVMAPVWFNVSRPGSFWGGRVLVQALKLWHPGNYFATSWTLSHWAYALAALGLCAVIVWRARRYEEHDRRFPAFLLGLAGLWTLAFLGSEVLPLRPVLAAQLYRTDVFLVVLALAAGGHLINKYWGSSRPMTWGLAGLLLFALATRPRPAFLVLVALLWTLWEWYNEREFEPYAPRLKAAIITVLGVTACYAFASLWEQAAFWAVGPDVALGALLLCLLMAGGLYARFTLSRWTMRLGTAVVLLFTFLPAVNVVLYRLEANAVVLVSAQDRQVQALAAWIGNLTSSDDRFLSPPMERFRVILRRSVVFEWLDGAAMHWAPGFEGLWLGRVRDFRVDPAAVSVFWKERDRETAEFCDRGPWTSPGETAYRLLDENALAGLTAKYGATHLIAYAGMPRFHKYFHEEGASKDYIVYQYLFNYVDKP